jgi:hypothetical protein
MESRWTNRLGSLALGMGAALGIAPSLPAQNVIVNADFNDAQTASGWFGVVQWNGGDDADGCHTGSSLSGSLDNDSVLDPDQGVTYAFASPTECLNVVEGQTIYTQIAHKSPFDVADAIASFPQADCQGETATFFYDNVGGSSSSQWGWHNESFVVPAGVLSISVAWISLDPLASGFTSHWDRAYFGLHERIFSDDFEARLCRWSAVDGADTIPPSDPVPVTGTVEGSTIHVTWGVSVDTGGSGLAGYRVGAAPFLTEVSCSEISKTLTQANAGDVVNASPGDWYVYVCAEDNAGNPSNVVTGGPFTVN